MFQRAAGLAIAIFLLGFVANAHALQITLDQSFGSDPASGPIVLNITAAADGSYVDIAMDVTGLSSPEFIKELYLNITDVSVLSGAIDSDGEVKEYQIADAGFKADGDGNHDVFIQLESAAAVRLNAGTTHNIRLYGTDLSEDMFDDY
jgi:hypothetical protein